MNESAIAKYGDQIDSYVTGVVNPGESFLEVDGAWVDWSEKIPEYQEAGTLVAYYDYDNFPLKAYADVRSEPEPEPVPAPEPTDEPVGGDPTPAAPAQPAQPAQPAKATALPKTSDSLVPWIAFATLAAGAGAASAAWACKGRRRANRS